MMLGCLPRSIRWKIHLGILDIDPDLEHHFSKQSVEKEGDTDSILKKIHLHNTDKLDKQRQHYDTLVKEHLWGSTPLGITQASESVKDENTSSSPNQSSAPETPKRTRTIVTSTLSKGNKTQAVDPLSMMASMEEEQVMIDKAREIEQKREQALAARSRSHSGRNSSLANNLTEKQVPKTRWNEFYTSKEIINIIEKDLDRLPVDHHFCFCLRKVGHRLSSESKIFDFDFSEPLPMDEEVVSSYKKKRSEIIAQILFVHAKEHPSLGYRQGMHEILSLVLLALEMDLLYYETIADHTTYFEDIVDQSRIVCDAFLIFEGIMLRLSLAYEVRDNQSCVAGVSVNNKSPMEVMGLSVLEKIRETAGDDELYNSLVGMNIPPELFCTRWIRLMFGREVKGLNDIMNLWETFFKLMSSAPKKASSASADWSTTSLMNVLETTAATMIMLLRDELLPQPTYQFDQFGNQHLVPSEPKDPNEAMHLLMNYPQMQDTTELTNLLHKMMACQESGTRLSTPRNFSRQPGCQLEGEEQSLSQSADKIQQGQMFHNESLDQYSHFNHQMSPDHQYCVNQHQSLDQHYQLNSDQLIYDPTQQNMQQNEGYMQSYNLENSNWNPEMKSDFSSLKKLARGKVNIGLNAVKGAWESIDNKLQNLSVSNNDNFKLGNNATSVSSFGKHDFNQDSATYFEYRNHENDSTLSVQSHVQPTISSRLEHSVTELNAYFERSVRSEYETTGRSGHIPQNIWDALAEIDSVKLELASRNI